MEEDDSGVLTLDLGELLRQEEELRLARLIIAEKTESESLARLEDPEGSPKLLIASKGTVKTLDGDGRETRVFRIVMENPASGEQFILDVGCVKAQHLIRELHRFYGQLCG